MGNSFGLNFQVTGAAPPQPSLTLHKLFPTVIWDVQLTQLRPFFDGWKQEIAHLRAADPASAGRSNRSGWHSEDRAILDKLIFAPLEAEIRRLTGHALDHVAGEHVPFKISSWVNMHDRGGLNQLHMHAHALLSGVFYLGVPEGSGPLMFRDPRPGVLHSPFIGEGPNALKSVSLPPSAGLLVLFPHWLEHWVEQHDNDEPRISIAFNAARF